MRQQGLRAFAVGQGAVALGRRLDHRNQITAELLPEFAT
jgi:hypothetical protein